MGWTLNISYGDQAEDANVTAAVDVSLLVALIEEVETKVDIAYAGYPPKKVIFDLCLKIARDNQCYTKNEPDLIRVRYRNNDVLLVRIGFLALPGQISDERTCPACKRDFIPDPNNDNSKWTEAHSVIPASMWSSIVPEALGLLMAEFAPSQADAANHQKVLDTIAYMKAQYGRNGFKDGYVVKGPTIRGFIASMCSSGASCSGPGASGPIPQGGAQCPRCEALHADLSLICRLKATRDLAFLGDLKDSMTGEQFIDYINKGGAPFDVTPEMITMKVADIVIDDMFASFRGTQASDGGAYLKTALNARKQRFKEITIAEAVRQCSVQVADAAKVQHAINLF